MKPKVLFIGDLNKELPQYKQFSDKYECLTYDITTREQVVKDFKEKFQDIEAIYGAWQGFAFVGGFNKELLDNIPPKVKIIAICSVGYDIYDYKTMGERGIILTNVPSTSAADPVADLVLYHALTSFRNLRLTIDNFDGRLNHTVKTRRLLEVSKFNTQTGQIDRSEEVSGYAYGETVGGLDCHNPRGHNAVIFGFGQIGQTIGQRLSAVGMNIHYIKRSQLSQDEESKLSYPVTYHKSLQDVTDIADLIVIAAPGTPETKHSINETLINQFSHPVRIVNVGRGSIIDENALVNGLKSGKVAYAGLDVFEDEPTVHPELLGRHDVVLTPHIGASTVENFDNTAITAMANIDNVLSGKDPLTKVN